MARRINHPEADRVAREPAAHTDESPTTRVVSLREELAAIRHRCASLPVLDERTPEEIVGYDE